MKRTITLVIIGTLACITVYISGCTAHEYTQREWDAQGNLTTYRHYGDVSWLSDTDLDNVTLEKGDATFRIGSRDAEVNEEAFEIFAEKLLRVMGGVL